MNIQRKAFESAMQELSGGQTKNDVNPVTGEYQYGVMQVMWSVWQKAQAVPEIQQTLNDRLLVKSIREHVESHISEISVNDLFDKGWLAAMKCIQNNIDMLEAQEPTND